jgi:molybdopterin/thiamine biosynthesis adenylyltransferase
MSTERYHRQMLVPGIGEDGQRRLAAAQVLVVGCGALGSVAADLLVRAGVGTIRLVDRDVVELTNLQRQVLYSESDIGAPKAIAARDRLQAVNSNVEIQAVIDDVDADTIRSLAAGCDLIIDGLDNFETRYLINDFSVSTGIPWIYGGAIGTTGMSTVLLPDDTPCLRCLFPDPPATGTTPTCETAGVLGPVIHRVAAHQITQAIKLLTGNTAAVDRTLQTFDVWSNVQHAMTPGGRRDDCPCCGRREFEWLDGHRTPSTTVLCGRDAVQIKPGRHHADVPLQELADRLAIHGSFRCTADVLQGRFADEDIELTVFSNGRALVKGSRSPEHARSVYARYIGT